MPDDPELTPEEHAGLTLADHDEIRKSLSFALRFDGRKRMHRADELMAGITADHLIRYLERSGYVVMKRPPSPTAWISPQSLNATGLGWPRWLSALWQQDHVAPALDAIDPHMGNLAI